MKKFKMHPKYLIIGLLVVLAIVVAALGINKYNATSQKSNDSSSVKSEVTLTILGPAKIIKQKPDGAGQSNIVEAYVLIKNNSANSIGLDPNACDFNIILNDNHTYPDANTPHPCTEIGGIKELKPGKGAKQQVWLHIEDAKVGDKIVVAYGYNVLQNPGSQAESQYKAENSPKAVSKPATIESSTIRTNQF